MHPRFDQPCPICGAAHTACTASTGPITEQLLPARDAAAARASPAPPLGSSAAPAGAVEAGGSAPLVGVDLASEPDHTTFSTATYRGKQKRGKG